MAGRSGARCQWHGPNDYTPAMLGRGGLDYRRRGEVAPTRLLPSAGAAGSSTQDEAGSTARAWPAPDARGSVVASPVSPHLEPAAAPGAPVASGARCLASSSVAGTRAGGLRAAACRRPAVSRTHGLGAAARSPPRRLSRGTSSSATAIQARSSDPTSGGWSGEQGWGRRSGGGGGGERGRASPTKLRDGSGKGMD